MTPGWGSGVVLLHSRSGCGVGGPRFMADVRNVTRWNESVSRAELTSDDPIGHGSQFFTVKAL